MKIKINLKNRNVGQNEYYNSFKYYNSFEEITCLDNYNNIKFIECVKSKLTELPELPDSLEILWCYKSKLTELPRLPDSLEELYCFDNQLTELPRLPNSLEILYCSYNQLTKLPRLPDSLKDIGCFNNQLTELPTLPDSIEEIQYFENPIWDFIINHFDRNIDSYQEWKQNCQKKFVRKISNWFLECKYNPKYAYCRRVINQGYDDLNNSV